MVGNTSTPPPADVRHARAAVAVVFFATGATSGTWFGRIPAIKDAVGLSAGELGLAVMALNAGALAALPVAGALVARVGSKRLLVASMLAYVGALPLIALAPTLTVLVLVLVVFAGANSGVDVAINAQGAHVERGYGRPLLSGLHGVFSLGTMAGAASGAAAAAGGVSPLAHFAGAGAVLGLVGIGPAARMVAEPRQVNPPRLALPSRALALPALVAFCADSAAATADSWAAVYVAAVVGSGPGLAAATVAVFAGAMAAGRLLADRVFARVGAARFVGGAGIVAAAGIGAAILAPHALAAGAGFFLLGLGLGPILPVLFSYVSAPRPAEAGVAIAAVSTVAYGGGTLAPVTVGGAAELVGLRGAMILVPSLALAMALLAGRLRS